MQIDEKYQLTGKLFGCFYLITLSVEMKSTVKEVTFYTEYLD